LAHRKSAKKSLKKNERARARNRAVKSKVATAQRRVREAAPDERDQAVRQAVSTIDRAAKKGVIKKSTAARRKSKLMRRPKAAE